MRHAVISRRAGAQAKPRRHDDKAPSHLRRKQACRCCACNSGTAERVGAVRNRLQLGEGTATPEAAHRRSPLRCAADPPLAPRAPDSRDDSRAEARSGQEAQAPRTRPPVLEAEQYKRRNAIERLVGWLKEHRSLATRFDKLASSFLAMVKLACIRRLLRAAFPITA